ncbi:MAG: hypothetical protein ABFS37_12915 [Acidobacteriota bacterium]
MRMKTLVLSIALLLTAGLMWVEGLRADATPPNDGLAMVTIGQGQGDTATFEREWKESPFRQQGACNNPADLAIINDAGFQDIFLACMLSCLGLPQCVSDCLVSDTGLSQGCADCFGALAGCVAINCSGPCSVDPSSPECLACMEAAGCTSDFAACSGLESIFADGFESGDTSAWN